MKLYWFLLFLVITPVFTTAQDSSVSYWVKFSDKANSPFSKFNPSKYLSQKAIKRRNVQDIPFNKQDFPVNPDYKHKVDRITAGVVLESKWLNGVVARISKNSMIRGVDTLAFTDTLFRVKGQTLKNQHLGTDLDVDDNLTYGAGLHQVEMLNGQFLHQMGYKGQEVDLAVLDAGFKGVKSLRAFNHLRQNSQLGLQQNLVNPRRSVTSSGTHGTSVLSVMGSVLNDTFTGVAPAANFHLFKSENTKSEFLVEEIAWVAAAEKADSVGAKIINSSLGYQDFEDSTTNHLYKDLDGESTLITRGAAVAAEKGMLVVSSAGNEGRSAWQYITAPADGKEVLTVGAVDSARARVAFSSVGPTADGRVKPDVMAMGAKTKLINANTGSVAQSFGTSFSAPLISGMAACLWQAFPNASNDAIREAIIQSGGQSDNPDSLKGYGIPDFYQAYVDLQADNTSGRKGSQLVRVYPNPFEKDLTVAFYSSRPQPMTIRIKSPMGKGVYKREVSLHEGLNRIKVLKFQPGQKSVYILNLELEQTRISKKLVHY